MIVALILQRTIRIKEYSFHKKLENDYQDYIHTWDEIYQINSDSNISIAKLFKEIKTNLIDTGYFTPQEMIKKINKASESRLRYRHAYIKIMNKLAKEYHCENMLKISSLSEYDNLIKNTYQEAILNDDEKSLLEFMKRERLDPSELLANCSLNGAENCFKLLRTKFNARVTKNCVANAFRGNNKYIIKECLKKQQPDSSSMEAAIASHDISNLYQLIDEYHFQISSFNFPILSICYEYQNLHVFIVYLIRSNDLDRCLEFSPVFHIRSLCRCLYNNGGDVRESGPDDATALQIAIYENQTDIAKDLISFGSDIKAMAPRNGNPIIFAVSSNNSELVELLISRGAYVNIHDPRTEFSLLHIATIFRNKKIIEILIKHGAFVNENSNKFGVTPLMLASLLNYKDIVKLLISRGERISRTDNYGNNALAYALLYNNKEFMEQILKRFNSMFQHFDYQLFDLESNNKDMINLLISYGANIQKQNKFGNSPLHIAALMSNGENTKLLISQGVDINSVNNNEETPLDIAIMRGKREFNKEFHDFEEEDYQNFIDFLEKKSDIVSILLSNDGVIYSNKEFKSNDIIHIMFDYFWERYKIIYPGIITLVIILGIIYGLIKLNQCLTNRFIKLIIRSLQWIIIGINFVLPMFYLPLSIYAHYYRLDIFLGLKIL
ncbi:hypothetical protein TVAG_223520 [Trichomonas vaginalis G3]|uniref:DUF3447 domain-containing protein n=1 Tax=Trichomonas vaginalis (strain ATCC PRA-98 / G3) TaxID=412133 RepID=A2EJ57_TRIV3|nr:protein ubiquitination [Trichomonas vaginalis G3]EAY07289.1 hypothetical protein TVAG_223520 [Trichomonas vaginalis G3]KAI5550462.1 protein ubiquitination [Trichomonas vaginalis G3]|eukprot:XP_001319512.1 hypothetical protein [Trichomonas vaginalis G3]